MNFKLAHTWRFCFLDGRVHPRMMCRLLKLRVVQDFVTVVFPTADRLKVLQHLAAERQRPLVVINPQWNLTAGQVRSFRVHDVACMPQSAKAPSNFGHLHHIGPHRCA